MSTSGVRLIAQAQGWHNQIASYYVLVFDLQKCFLLLQVHDKIGPSELWSLM